MPQAAHTQTTQEAPTPHKGGFPPFDTTTFPSQLFWLAITFGVLFTVLSRAAGPRIKGAITLRRDAIKADLAAAQQARGDAQSASAAYETALTAARGRAQALAEETRQRLTAEIAKAKAETDAQAAAGMAAADARIAAARSQAMAHVATAARDAAIEIVARLTGDKVSADDAAKAVREV